MTDIQLPDIFQERAAILGQKETAAGIYLIELAAAEIASTAKPGQFVMVRPTQDIEPLLRRPLSIHRVDKFTITLLYQVVGKGTRQLREMSAPQFLDIIGPLGNGFSFSEKTEKAVMVAGGIGIAPLAFLAEHLRRNRPETGLYLYYGARTGKEIVGLELFQQLSVDIRITTDDGTKGEQGVVTSLLARDLNDFKNAVLYGCGPEPMLKALKRVTNRTMQGVQVSVEANMACGMGVCLGCAVMTKNGYRHVCRDGPVFNLRELPW